MNKPVNYFSGRLNSILTSTYLGRKFIDFSTSAFAVHGCILHASLVVREYIYKKVIYLNHKGSSHSFTDHIRCPSEGITEVFSTVHSSLIVLLYRISVYFDNIKPGEFPRKNIDSGRMGIT